MSRPRMTVCGAGLSAVMLCGAHRCCRLLSAGLLCCGLMIR